MPIDIIGDNYKGQERTKHMSAYDLIDRITRVCFLVIVITLVSGLLHIAGLI